MNIFGELQSRICEHKIIRDYNTLGVGGVADYFFEANSLDDLVKIGKLAKNSGFDYRVIGLGSEIIFSDFGFKGLIIRNNAAGFSVLPGSSAVLVESGMALDSLVVKLANLDIGGLEGYCYYQGTLGGAVWRNIESSDQNLKESKIYIGSLVKKITLLSSRGEPVVRKPKPQAEGGAEVFLKGRKSGEIVLTVKLQLLPRRKEDVVRSLKDRRVDYRGLKMSGEIFWDDQLRRAEELFLETRAYKLRHNHACCSKRYPNRIINRKNATAGDVRALIEKIRAHINEKTGIVLKEKIEYLGEW